jgi:hypothetical protein
LDNFNPLRGSVWLTFVVLQVSIWLFKRIGCLRSRMAMAWTLNLWCIQSIYPVCS